MESSDELQKIRIGKQLAVIPRVLEGLHEPVPLLPVAYATNGRTFGYEAPFSMSFLLRSSVGLNAQDGTEYLGQIVTKEVSIRQGAEIGLTLHTDGRPRTRLRADGLDRHTSLCGQTGSGKTFALGVILELLLLETDLKILILDPNSDFVRLDRILELISQTFSQAPSSFLDQSPHFAQGECLFAGKIVQTPSFGGFEERYSEEGRYRRAHRLGRFGKGGG
jgi:hypothetical protein